jgi:hypothetical protein
MVEVVYALIREIQKFVRILSTEGPLCPSLVYVRTSSVFGIYIGNGRCPSFNTHFPIKVYSLYYPDGRRFCAA